MSITPRRRQRMICADQLRQIGRSRSQSAEILDVSRATAHAKLQIAAPDQPEQTEHGWTRLNDPERPEHAILSKTLEILPSDPVKKNSAEHLNAPLPPEPPPSRLAQPEPSRAEHVQARTDE